MHVLKFSEQEIRRLYDILDAIVVHEVDTLDLKRTIGYLLNWDPNADRFHMRCKDDNLKQHIIQAIFNLPLKHIPLQINHKSSCIRAIAKWRLELAR
jgi:hypothetical protein